ncbi:MAG: serine/threonine protein kinase [Deltaproteobacteria bacterium]|nr:serine/threonine protein kinase [Deltaproteobacteria bacterium]
MGIDAPRSEEGSVLGGQWRLERPLGRGGTSTVWAATSSRDGRRGAVKVFHPELSKHARVLELLLAEARHVAAIEHPGTVKVQDEGVDGNGCAFLVFELLVGQTLEELRQARGGRVPLEEVMRIGDAVMDALAAVHDAGVVHRDLKPHNIFVLEGGGVKLLDFGLSKIKGRTAHAAQNVFGTPSYMPPEQAMGLTKKIDPQSDVWSLGATLFTALSGQPVHVGESIDAMLLATANTRPRSLADVAPEIDSKVIAVIDKAISYQKADRWPDVRAMRAAWQAAHPAWLPTLPPPSFSADPEFLDAGLAELVPQRAPKLSLFDPRELLEESSKPAPHAHPGPIPTAGGSALSPTIMRRRRIEIVVALAAVVFLVLAVLLVLRAR